MNERAMLKLRSRPDLSIPELDDFRKKKSPHAHRVRFSPEKLDKKHKNNKNIFAQYKKKIKDIRDCNSHHHSPSKSPSPSLKEKHHKCKGKAEESH